MARDTGLKKVWGTGMVGLGGGMGGHSGSTGGRTIICGRKDGRGGGSIRELTRENYVELKYHIGTSPTVPLDSVLVLENHHSTMSIIRCHI